MLQRTNVFCVYVSTVILFLYFNIVNWCHLYLNIIAYLHIWIVVSSKLNYMYVALSEVSKPKMI